MTDPEQSRADDWQAEADNLARKAQRAGSPQRRAVLAEKALAAGLMAEMIRERADG